MTGMPSVSIVIPSRDRKELVPELITALRQLRYPIFEVILVGEYQTIAAFDLPEEVAASIHYFPCYAENISRARNVGIRAARGEVVAFIDDDAIPEPDWLCQLAPAFNDADIGLAGGRVRDRDGVRFQFTGGRFDRTAEQVASDDDFTIDRVFEPDIDTPAALMGTNCAFRRSALLAAGGFDESYEYFLDETDIVLRLNDAGWKTAWRPEAEVHHRFEKNRVRTQERVPADPFQLGASKAYFGERHASSTTEADAAQQRFLERFERDLDDHIRLGRISRQERGFLEQRMRAGLIAGLSRRAILPLMANARARLIVPFRARLPNVTLSLAIIAETGVNGALVSRRLAHALGDRGHRITLVTLGDDVLPLKVSFTEGIWRHRGGAWRSFFQLRLAKLLGWHNRCPVVEETLRASTRRAFDAVLVPRQMSAGFSQFPCRTMDFPDLGEGWEVTFLRDQEGRAADELITRLKREVRTALTVESGLPLPWDPAFAIIPTSSDKVLTR